MIWTLGRRNVVPVGIVHCEKCFATFESSFGLSNTVFGQRVGSNKQL
jgi:hypothetical protein